MNDYAFLFLETLDFTGKKNYSLLFIPLNTYTAERAILG